MRDRAPCASPTSNDALPTSDMNEITKVHSSFPQPASYDRKVYLTLSSLLTAPGAVSLTRQLPTGLQGACNGCQKTLHVSHVTCAAVDFTRSAVCGKGSWSV